MVPRAIERLLDSPKAEPEVVRVLLAVSRATADDRGKPCRLLAARDSASRRYRRPQTSNGRKCARSLDVTR